VFILELGLEFQIFDVKHIETYKTLLTLTLTLTLTEGSVSGIIYIYSALVIIISIIPGRISRFQVVASKVNGQSQG
jgi:hypothetical protein